MNITSLQRTTLWVCVLLLGLSLLLLSACGGQNSVKGGGGGEHNKSESGGTAATNGQIAFRRYFDPDQTESAIFTMNPDGSHVSQITHPPEGWRDDTPVWSPDGKKVAFQRERPDESMSRIMVLNTDTGDTHEVTHCGPDQGWTKEHPAPSGHCVTDFDPAFSPDGDSLAFHRILGPDKECQDGPEGPGGCRIEGNWIVGLDGSNPHQVTNVDPKLPTPFFDRDPAFSPDGKMLVFIRDNGIKFAVFVQPIGSPQDAHQITPWKMNCQDHPEFSPDGKLVLFRCPPEDEEGPSNLYWVHPDGTGLHALTHEDADKQYLGSCFSPSFSGGEGWITAGRTGGYGKEGNADVFRVRIEDGEVVRSENLTKNTLWDSAPCWGSHPPVD
jgi:Tol biopolymer transport system component